MHPSSPSEARARVDAWLDRLGRRSGLHLQLNEDGVCAIGHASGLDLVVQVPPAQGLVLLGVALLELEALRHAGLARECLARQAAALVAGGGSLGGCVFALDPQTDELLLLRALPVDALDADRFQALVVDTLDTAERWAREFRQFDAAAPAPDAAPAWHTGREAAAWRA